MDMEGFSVIPRRSAVQFILTKVIACYLVVSGVVLLFVMLWSYNHYQNSQYLMADKLQTVVASVVERAPYNLEQMSDWLEVSTKLFISDDVPLQSFALLGEDGKVVFSWPNRTQVDVVESQLLKTFSIKNSSFVLALAFPESSISHVFNQNLFIIAGILLGQLVLLLVVLKIVVHRGIRSAFEDFMRELGLIRLQRPAPLQANSFLGQFSEYRLVLAGVNRVILSLAKSREELSDVNHSLEQHIHAKTAALKERNQELLELNQQLSVIANTDALTQVYNRTRFDTLFREYVALAERRNTSLAILLVDLDDFKKVNDKFGHQTGDHVLKHAAQVIQSEVGEDGIVARWGGEEFAVLLPYFDLCRAEEKAEDLRATLARSRFEEQSIRVTTSIGVAQLSENETGAQLLKRADDALYDAKGSGRNRVIIAYINESHTQLELNTLTEGEFIEVLDADSVPSQDELEVSRKHLS